jgi:uncharacterized membrane protein YbaN (DUF454 family)
LKYCDSQFFFYILLLFCIPSRKYLHVLGILNITSKQIRRLTERRARKTQRKYKILAAVLTCVFAISVVFAAVPSMASWISNSVVNVTSSSATDTFTTTVTGLQTNAEYNPIDINGVTYAGNVTGQQPNGGSPITAFSDVSYGTGGQNSTAAINSGGWVAGDWALLQVTIQNTGSVTLNMPTYSIANYFVDSSGNFLTPQPAGTSPYYLNNEAMTTGNFGQDIPTADIAQMNGPSWNNWYNDNIWNYQNQGAVMPTILAPGATFTYYIFTGLGLTAPYPISNQLYSISILLMPAN